MDQQGFFSFAAKSHIPIKSIHPNIFRLYLIKIAKWFMLYMPIVVPFYESNGLSMKDIMILQAVYSIAIVVLEIPSGYLADVIGRRKTLIIGAMFGTIGFATYSFSYGFIGFLIAEIILGIGQSCISGADSAMLYDSLLERGEEKKYSRFEGRITSLGNMAEAAAGIMGGLLAGITLQSPLFCPVFCGIYCASCSHYPGGTLPESTPYEGRYHGDYSDCQVCPV